MKQSKSLNCLGGVFKIRFICTLIKDQTKRKRNYLMECEVKGFFEFKIKVINCKRKVTNLSLQ